MHIIALGIFSIFITAQYSDAAETARGGSIKSSSQAGELVVGKCYYNRARKLYTKMEADGSISVIPLEVAKAEEHCPKKTNYQDIESAYAKLALERQLALEQAQREPVGLGTNLTNLLFRTVKAIRNFMKVTGV